MAGVSPERCYIYVEHGSVQFDPAEYSPTIYHPTEYRTPPLYSARICKHHFYFKYFISLIFFFFDYMREFNYYRGAINN